MSTTESRKRRANLSEGEKAQILLMKSEGYKAADIAAHIGVNTRIVFRHLAALKKAAAVHDPEHPAKGGPAQPSPRDTVNSKAYTAIEAGLDCVEDPYKRGNLGVRVLQGTGEFKPDNAVNINTLIQNVPPEYRERYLVSTEDEQ